MTGDDTTADGNADAAASSGAWGSTPGRTMGGGWVPVPDPTALTSEAVARSASAFRREMDGLRELLSERIMSEMAARDTAIKALRDVADQRVKDLDASIERRFSLTADLPERIKADRRADLKQLRQLLETRLAGMDKATELLAGQVARVPSETDKAIIALRELIEQRLSDMDHATTLLIAEHGQIRATSISDMDHIRTELFAKAQALRELMEQRLDLMDKATTVLATSVEKFPSDTDRAASNVREVLLAEIARVQAIMVERFAAVDALFDSNALALTAALAAQEKAVAEQNRSNTLAITKSEVSTKETIAANAAQTQTGLASLDAKMTDIKERVVRIESTGAGAVASQAVATDASHYDQSFAQNAHLATASNLRTQVSTVVAVIAVVISVIALAVLILKKLDPKGA